MRHTTFFSVSPRNLFCLLLISQLAAAEDLCAQQNDSTFAASTKVNDRPFSNNYKLTVRRLVVPVSLITYGVIAQMDEDLRDLDLNMKAVVRRDGDFRTRIDDYLQYSPAMAVYALNAVGIKGRHNFGDRTLIYLLSNAMMGLTVNAVKKISRVQRPDGYGNNAFPSGHTATAFVGAEFLRQEYKDVSPWYGISGYAAATTTGILRMYNNKHWFRDVMAGAGIGILATQTAYWLEPIIAEKLFHKKHRSHFYPANI